MDESCLRPSHAPTRNTRVPGSSPASTANPTPPTPQEDRVESEPVALLLVRRSCMNTKSKIIPLQQLRKTGYPRRYFLKFVFFDEARFLATNARSNAAFSFPGNSVPFAT